MFEGEKNLTAENPKQKRSGITAYENGIDTGYDYLSHGKVSVMYPEPLHASSPLN